MTVTYTVTTEYKQPTTETDEPEWMRGPVDDPSIQAEQPSASADDANQSAQQPAQPVNVLALWESAADLSAINDEIAELYNALAAANNRHNQICSEFNSALSANGLRAMQPDELARFGKVILAMRPTTSPRGGK